MSTAWGGGNPTSFVDLGDYELGEQYKALVDITITDLRLFGGDGNSYPGRTGRIWNPAGNGAVAILGLPTVLTSGWAQYPLAGSVPIQAGTTFWVSYTTQGAYGFLGSNSYPLNSGDNSVQALAAGFNNTPTNLPDSLSPGGFFGVDFVYTVGIAGQQAPVASLNVTTSGLGATATVGITDEAPANCSIKVEWGDGTQDVNVGPQAFAHTYALPGEYAVLVTVTDPTGLVDAATAIARVVVSYASPLAAGTLDFIQANPITLALLPRVETRTAAAGKVRETGPARAAQTFRLVPQNTSSANSPGVVQTADGTQRKATHVLVGMPDAVMAVGDTWKVGSTRYEIMELLPDNGYERRARVMADG
jgi:PKD repeat protein